MNAILGVRVVQNFKRLAGLKTPLFAKRPFWWANFASVFPEIGFGELAKSPKRVRKLAEVIF